MQRVMRVVCPTLLVAVSSCYVRRPVVLSPAGTENHRLGDDVSILLADTRRVDLVYAWVEDDSVVGFSKTTRVRDAHAVSDVRSVESRVYSSGRTTAVLAVPAAAIFVVSVSLVLGFLGFFGLVPPKWVPF